MSQTILIIGGGIAGLCSAITLQQMGMKVKVYERNTEPAVAGAGIIIAPNALQALEPYRISDEIIRQGNPSDGFHILSDQGRTLTQLSVPSGFGSLHSIHRKDLHHILLSALPPDTVEWGKQFLQLEQKDNHVRVAFSDGSQAVGDWVVAADGIHSNIRKQIFQKDTYRYAGYTCWRGVVSVDGLPCLSHRFIETWGTKGRFGIVPLPKNKVYWYALINARQSDPRVANYSTKDLHRLFQNYHDPIPSLLLKTTSHDMIHRDIVDIVPMERFYLDRVVFIGDAAHAITPNMGQGACQAMEDARILAECLRIQSNYQGAFADYDAKRRERIKQISNQSWKIGKIAQSESFLFTSVRNRLMKHAPKRISHNQAQRLYKFQL
ncbi:FAD-dependent oxidoreductase [Domibacillus sp. PGB-M46]|uniref:FAD-dependent monooxygenase n=1 Tax=Domibacillus sp. PGB-M46 TaxID=2910255 RepID=UPI001F56842E|nr:FAD-dependent monooxygenase [Domibacillus sp. PGB-M46]MCI2255806.1 FAD-dependent oxidoreductase [Domibacillus sp. PGB-M46]